MRSARAACAAAILSLVLTGCAGLAQWRGAEECCPACRVTVKKRASLLGRVPAHTHVRYLCSSCGKEWEGEAEGGAQAVCPKCGRTLKRCPACCQKNPQP